MTETDKEKQKWTMDDLARIHEGLIGKLEEWSETKIPRELKLPYVIGYQETLQKVEAKMNESKPKTN